MWFKRKLLRRCGKGVVEGQAGPLFRSVRGPDERNPDRSGADRTRTGESAVGRVCGVECRSTVRPDQSAALLGREDGAPEFGLVPHEPRAEQQGSAPMNARPSAPRVFHGRRTISRRGTPSRTTRSMASLLVSTANATARPSARTSSTTALRGTGARVGGRAGSGRGRCSRSSTLRSDPTTRGPAPRQVLPRSPRRVQQPHARPRPMSSTADGANYGQGDTLLGERRQSEFVEDGEDAGEQWAGVPHLRSGDEGEQCPGADSPGRRRC